MFIIELKFQFQHNFLYVSIRDYEKNMVLASIFFQNLMALSMMDAKDVGPVTKPEKKSRKSRESVRIQTVENNFLISVKLQGTHEIIKPVTKYVLLELKLKTSRVVAAKSKRKKLTFL